MSLRERNEMLMAFIRGESGEGVRDEILGKCD